MLPTSVIALFCEDIREEKGDIFTLVGILPDNIEIVDRVETTEIVPVAPKALPKIHVYIRTNFDPSAAFEAGMITLVTPDGTKHMLGSIEATTIAQAKSLAKDVGNPIAGVISRSMIAFAKRPNGRFHIEVTLGEETFLAGTINFKDE